MILIERKLDLSGQKRQFRCNASVARNDTTLPYFADAADVFDAVLRGEAKVAAQAVAHVVAVQHKGMAAALVQLFLDGMCQGGFARAGQAGEPDDGAAMVVLFFAPRAGDGGVVPDGVG